MNRTLVSFGQSDPLHLTEALHATGLDATYVWGPHFNRPCPEWADGGANWGYDSLYDAMSNEDTVYCGHGATLLEATAAGCAVQCLHDVDYSEPTPRYYAADEWPPCGPRYAKRLHFVPAWADTHLDHSGHRVVWWAPGVMEAMARELRERRTRHE